MLAAQRRQLILRAVRTDQGAEVVDLAHRFGVSEITVRRDLTVLAQEGKLTRVHGGAIGEADEPPFETTQSERARKVLAQWADMVPRFVKVYPNDYRRVIETQKRFKAQGLSDEEAIMAAFEENAHDLARVGGK